MSYTMGSLFSGIGGFELGFERAGFKTSWQVEIDPYCQKVLAKNFPEAERFGDIRECGSHNLKPVDVICGGFPCQDISNAGKRAGIGGERSGLWSEYARIIRELRPRFVLVENVAALLGRGMGVVLGDLAALGYDAEWQVISAADMGAPHLRERVWIISYPIGQRHDQSPAIIFTDSHQKWDRKAHQQSRRSVAGEAISGGEEMAHPVSLGRPGSGKPIEPLHSAEDGQGEASDVVHVCGRNNWELEPQLGRVVDGVPVELVANELRGLGNAVVPQIPEMIARRIKQALNEAA